jgi:hypothetical protein
MADEEQQHDILTALGMILAPLDEEQRDAILAGVKREIEERAIVSSCWDGTSQATDTVEASYVWNLTQPSPMNPSHIVFAMLHWEEINAVVIYTVGEKEVEGGKVFEFAREIVFNPKHIAGPLSHEALFKDLMEFLVDDEEQTATNGSARPATRRASA